MNGGLGNAKFNSLKIILVYKTITSIILGKNLQKFWKKTTKKFRWSTQGGDFNTNYTSKV